MHMPDHNRLKRLKSAAVILLVFLFGLQPALNYLGFEPANAHHFEFLQGSLPALIATLVLVAWGTAAFGEEIVFRGFVLQRLERSMGRSTWAAVMAIVLQAAVFGLAHYSAGWHGIISAGVIALILGTVFVVSGRNLWSMIPAHGIVDTISLIQVYASA